VDIDGTPAYEFTKWRAKKRGVKCSFELAGPYDYILCLDSIEHLANWREDLAKLMALLKPMGVLFTNYFINQDFSNTEHISMDHEAVKKYLTTLGIFPVNRIMWLKQDMSLMVDKAGLESAA
jgi:2-polyprenyl-3-methyl-5-hydroxy-6-metoxy-1,4-benzoquinol methylase